MIFCCLVIFFSNVCYGNLQLALKTMNSSKMSLFGYNLQMQEYKGILFANLSLVENNITLHTCHQNACAMINKTVNYYNGLWVNIII